MPAAIRTTRPSVLVGMALAAVFACGAQAEAAKAPAGPAAAKAQGYDPRDLSGVWFQTGGGKFGPYPWTPEYEAIAKQRAAAMAAGHPYQPSGSSCLPRGLVGMMTTGAYPLEIFQTPTRITVAKENGGLHRIYLNRKHLSEDDLSPLFFGDSVAHWEGDVLVVDSISLGATDNIDGQNPHSDAMHVVERYRRTGPKTMKVQVTVDDPKAFTHPISTTAQFTARPDYELQEYYCVNERNVVDKSGAQVVAGTGR
jgi:hypothetical protein